MAISAGQRGRAPLPQRRPQLIRPDAGCGSGILLRYPIDRHASSNLGVPSGPNASTW